MGLFPAYMTGQSAEFNGVIERIVQSKLKELGAALNEQLTQFENAEQISTILNEVKVSTQDINEKPLEGKLTAFFKLCERVKDIFGNRLPQTDAEDALLRIIKLVNSLPTYSKSLQG